MISDNSSEDESIEITDEPQESADTEGEDTEIDIQEEEEASPEDVFSAEDEIAVLNDEGETQSKNVKSVKLDTSNCKKFIYGMDYAWMDGLSLDVTYEDDSKDTVTFADGGIWANDTYGNSFHYDIVDADNASCISNELEKDKTYMLVVYQSGTSVAEKEISAVSIEESDNFRDVSLNVGLNSDIDSPEEEEVYYKFTAPEADVYYIASSPDCGDYAAYRETETGYERDYGKSWNLEEGESLYFGFSGGVWLYDDEDEYLSNKVEVCIEKGSKSIDSVELEKNSCSLTIGLESQHLGREIVKKLKEVVPRQSFEVSLQAAIGGKFIARENIGAYRKDVTGYLYGGDVSRKKKLLAKQARGKKRMKRFGKVDIPSEAFMVMLKRD